MNKFDCSTDTDFSTSEKAIASLLKFFKRIRLYKAISKSIHDPRKKPYKYSLQSIIISALSTVFFRKESKNAFKTSSHAKTSNQNSFALLFDDGSKMIPDTKTIDDVLSKIDIEDFNKLNFNLFKYLLRSKFFLNHPKLTADFTFDLAIDGECVHTYSPESSHDTEECPYCLKRVYANGSVRFLHVDVVASIVCPGKIKLPIFSYRVHSLNPSNGKEIENLSEKKFKQECEQSALPIILERIRKEFPRLKFHVLLDALYANAPVLNTIKKYNMGYTVVFKKKQLRTIREDCKGLEKIKNYSKDNHLVKKTCKLGKKKIEEFTWYTHMSYKDLEVNVIKYNEKIEKSSVCWEWITSRKLNETTVSKVSNEGRLRWQEEDMFNSFEERGYAIHHDYSRKPKIQIIWGILIHIAFFINELYVNSDLVSNYFKGKQSIKEFIKSIYYQILYGIRNRIWACCQVIGLIQFRYKVWCGGP